MLKRKKRESRKAPIRENTQHQTDNLDTVPFLKSFYCGFISQSVNELDKDIKVARSTQAESRLLEDKALLEIWDSIRKDAQCK